MAVDPYFLSSSIMSLCFYRPTGTTTLLTRMVDSMAPGTVPTSNTVVSIKQEHNTVLVAIRTGKQFQAEKAILAIIPNAYNDITFTPPPPAAKQVLGAESKPGIYAKVVVTYAVPWWRTAGLRGKFFSNIGPVCFTWDLVDAARSQYSLALFVGGDIAAAWHALPDHEKNDAVVEHLAKLVGADLADQARDTLEVNRMEWTGEEYIGGGPTSAMGPGMLAKYGEVLRAVGGLALRRRGDFV